MTTIVAASRPSGSIAPPKATIRLRSRVAVILKYASLVIASLVTLTPLGVVLIASFKTNDDWSGSGPFALPVHFSFENYRTFLTKGHVVQAFVNTTIILAVSLVGTLIIGTMAAYAIDRFEFRFKKLVVLLFLLATLVPGVTTQVATFKIINSLGLFDTRWSAIVLFMGTDILSIYIFIQFMRSIPKDLDEAAALDGAGHLTIYWRVIVPLLKPAIATVVIVKGIAIYNEFYIPFLYMPSQDLGVISTSLFRFKGPFGAQWEVISAGVVVIVIPTLAVFLALQRFIYNGFTAGSVK